tara:strand:- start:129 stop:305 length:177 start_codon:yes stop_codon:yes gene_type:complete
MYGRIKNPEEYGKWTRAIKRFWRKLWCCTFLMCNPEKCKCECHEHKCGCGGKNACGKE